MDLDNSNIKIAIRNSNKNDWFIFLQCDNLVGRFPELKERNVIWDVATEPKAKRLRDITERVNIKDNHEFYSVWKNCKGHNFVCYKGDYTLLPTNSFIFFGKGVDDCEINCKLKVMV